MIRVCFERMLLRDLSLKERSSATYLTTEWQINDSTSSAPPESCSWEGAERAITLKFPESCSWEGGRAAITLKIVLSITAPPPLVSLCHDLSFKLILDKA